MLPESFYTAQNILEDLGINPELPSSFNFRLDVMNDRVAGFVDKAEALAQAVYMMLMTEKGKYSIYPEDYGLQKADLYGKSRQYVEAALSYRIPACLRSDSRITAVNDIEYGWSGEKCVIWLTISCVFDEEIQVQLTYDMQNVTA